MRKAQSSLYDSDSASREGSSRAPERDYAAERVRERQRKSDARARERRESHRDEIRRKYSLGEYRSSGGGHSDGRGGGGGNGGMCGACCSLQ